MTRIYSNQPLVPPQNKKSIKVDKKESDFKQLLQDKLKNSKKLKFSKHAAQRLKSREIDFDGQELQKLEEAVAKAKAKGAQESLVLTDNNAYIVSVKNETVITAMDEESSEENLFTDIDSAIVMK
ncbi:flagellar protein [Natroniella acetigena]|uniref:TIGR02530 family flagellar biosynthesis protein n=1 Tax=Natroniella acetigena TaxID=52004 RepID=UPI00200B6CE9|nr:TIGR02530 family flagellar biosynthesis protein [Natroniella acetigena]MCK8826310.1 flagellar protein [Natroniella acetigena]